MRPIALGILSTIVLCGCSGRGPQPLVQQIGLHLTCEEITAEIQANNARITDLAREEGLKVTQNVAAGVAGLFTPVLWFEMDFQDAAGKEGKALSQRNQYLGTLAQYRCGAPPTGQPPIGGPVGMLVQVRSWS